MPVDRSVSIDRLRSTVARHVEMSSLRQVAREIGMSPSGLLSFVRSAGRRAPHARTYQMLVSWFVRTTLVDAPGASTDAAQAGVEILVQYLPPTRRADAVREILTIITAHADGGRPPTWLRELRARYAVPRKRRTRQAG